VQEHINRRAI